MEIGLVSCTKSKLDEAAKPRDLYMASNLFEKKRRFVEANHDTWYILSAKHHLLDPNGPLIEPYDDTLSGARVAKRREWSQTVYKQLQEQNLLSHSFVIHAGKDYYGELLPLLDQENVDYRIPTEGLGIGEKLAWYNKQIQESR
ncbi:DUF6884 domain-containing protein [Haloarcula argentinensis]|uniref:DUF6884 domain-containing protein n=1 Tax=Haloarcula argentinensis TaxID=43776 RepID=A0A847UIH1_HALAR|nr:DUF6884 domain-containing protein [Haloarcula argentinensis]NLV13239.1 hypothetical protein [Haloarcula argentinensis]